MGKFWRFLIITVLVAIVTSVTSGLAGACPDVMTPNNPCTSSVTPRW